MPKNQVQFQKGLSIPAFLERYGSEPQREQALFATRWPQGFQCPLCGYAKHCRLHTRWTLTSLLFSAIMKCTRPPGPLDCHSCHSPNSPKLRRYSKGSCETPGLGWVNTLLGNVKRSIDGTYHACSSRYAGRYLAEFAYRFNRRYQLADLVPRLAYVAARTAPLPYRLLTLAGTSG